MFKMTDNAATQVMTAARESGTEGMALRLATKLSDDGTFEYFMGFDETKEEDVQLNFYGVDVVMDAEFAVLLDETTMDYTQLDDGEIRFIFINPKDNNYTAPET
ncbi:MAG: iron-sulfur cluster assembly accessory protein [Gammaproteobacteria bacterium]|nr:iron-sulfur cluster assembly accessory protein [Gammaproteobacteria bacterium]